MADVLVLSIMAQQTNISEMKSNYKKIDDIITKRPRALKIGWKGLQNSDDRLQKEKLVKKISRQKIKLISWEKL